MTFQEKKSQALELRTTVREACVHSLDSQRSSGLVDWRRGVACSTLGSPMLSSGHEELLELMAYFFA